MQSRPSFAALFPRPGCLSTGRSSSLCSASQDQIDSQERESNPPGPAYETGEQPLLPSCNASRLCQRTGLLLWVLRHPDAWSAFPQWTMVGTHRKEARIRLRPRVRRGHPVEGWDLNPHLSDPQSDARPLSYLPHVFCGGGFEPPTSCSQGRPVTATVSTDFESSGGSRTRASGFAGRVLHRRARRRKSPGKTLAPGARRCLRHINDM